MSLKVTCTADSTMPIVGTWKILSFFKKAFQIYSTMMKKLIQSVTGVALAGRMVPSSRLLGIAAVVDLT